ncbi:MAG: TIM barrel protein [Candidatus Altiarchaeota archaeon]
MSFRFGTGGVPISCDERTRAAGVRCIKELGLSAMEVEFVRGVNLSVEKAEEVRKVAEELDIALSVHAPYFINLASPEKPKIHASRKRILDSARVGAALGARIVVFHPGFYMGRTPADTYELVKESLVAIRKDMKNEGIEILLGPEVTGKVKQFGGLDELIPLCQEVEGCMPVLDFAHLHARQGGVLTSPEAFWEPIEKVSKAFPKKRIHAHFACIEFSDGGEKKHLTLDTQQPDYTLLAKALKGKKIDITFISESPNLEEDAVKLKEMLC